MQDETPTSTHIAIGRSRWHRHALYTLALLTGALCTPAIAGTLQGTALYRERIALPPAAVFEAVLEEVSHADAPARVLGRARVDPAGSPPFRFEIAYDDAAVQPGHRYVVRATVTHEGRVWFTTDQSYPVLDGRSAPLSLLLVAAPTGVSAIAGTADADAMHLPASWEGKVPGADGTVRWHLDLLPEHRYRLRRTYEGKPSPNRFDEIGRWARAGDGSRLDLYVAGEKRVQFLIEAGGSLRKLDSAGKPIASDLNDRLERLPQPELIEPQLKISGLFVYMADAAVITLCADNSRLPVAMEGDFRALQAAYQKARPSPGEALLATVEGRIASRPSMEESLPPRDTLLVERFISLSPHASCGGARHSPPLRGTSWKLVRLGETPVQVSAGQAEPQLVFATDTLQVSGSGGCNRVAGGFTLEGDRLHLGPLAGTMMACLNGMEQEQRFLESLNRVERYRISGQQLELLDSSGTVLARFEAAAPR
jgi:copper homeostasis protein (lipoprotein)